MNDNTASLHFVSLNVRGIRDQLKRKKIFSWLLSQKTDIVCLQETFLSKELEDKVISEWSGPCYFSYGSNHSKGVSILFRKNLPSDIVNVYVKCDGRALAIRILYHKTCYLILNVYAPTRLSDKGKFFKNLSIWFNKIVHQDDLLICGGDWNTTLAASLDTRGVARVYKIPLSFRKFIQKNKLVDVWRKMYPTKKQFTWRQNSLGIYSRLDYWLISSTLCPVVISADIRPALKCDHNAISLKLKIRSSVRGKGYWKMNNALLLDDSFKQYIKNLIQQVKLEYVHENPQVIWEICKIKIREFAIKYSKEKQKKSRSYFDRLQNELAKQSEKVDNNPSESEFKKLEKIREEVDKLYTYKCKGAYVRSREKWMEFGEKSTKYFLKRETSNGKKKEIDCIQQNGKTITGKDEILKTITNYFSRLYSCNDIVTNANMVFYLQNSDLPMLSETDAFSCEGLLTENECFRAVHSMPNNKAPGCDGLSPEFYKCFWPDLKNVLIDSLNDGYYKGELSQSQRQGILTLLFKKGDKRVLDNWRPISLLNTDYKILARVLSQRLQRVIQKLVSSDQTGYIKGRSAANNLRLVQDVIDYCNILEEQGLILFLDFKQAFDCVNHDFLFETLKLFNFKDSFINWIRVLYANIEGKIINNGWISQTFKINRGVRQGCPLSALLFILIVEVMASRIRSNINIHGIRIPTHEEPHSYELRISQLADDTALFVSSIESANTAIQEVITFGEHAGLKLNLQKTKVMPLNINCNDEKSIHHIEWSEEPIKYLGVALTSNTDLFNELNWLVKIDKIQKVISLWKMRNLTFYGKIVVIKILLISQLIYLGTCYTMPPKYVKKLNKILYSFLWNSKREKVKRAVVINSTLQGGLGMVDLDAKLTSLRLSWIPKILHDSKQPWKYLCLFWTHKLGGMPFCLQCNCSAIDMSLLCKKHSIPPFYSALLVSWAELHYKNLFDISNVHNEIIWYNSNIKERHRLLHFKSWHEKGIVRINQLFENGSWKDVAQINDMLMTNSLLTGFQYLRIKAAFPNFGLDLLIKHREREEMQQNMHNAHLFQIKTGDFIDPSATNAKQFYSLVVDLHRISSPSVLFYWQDSLDLGEDFDWNTVFEFKFGKFLNNRIKEYNFKILHRILPFKENLARWNITSDMTCSHCNGIETVDHALLHCPEVDLFWKKVRYFIFNKFNINTTINKKLLITGYKIEDKNLTIPNIILNFAQYTIYRVNMLHKFSSIQFNSFSLSAELRKDLKINIVILSENLLADMQAL